MSDEPDSADNLSESSDWDGLTDELPADADMSPGVPTRGVPTRLAAERDVMAVLAAAFVGSAALAVASALITWDGRVGPGPWPIFALVVPHLLVLAGVLAAVYLILPAARWLAPEDLARRRRPPLLRLARALGFLAVPVAPILEARDRHEHGRILARDEVEHALVALLGLPRACAGLVLGGLAAVAVSDALIAGHQLLWTWPTTVGHLALWLALAGPLTVLSAAGVRQALRADLLAAPQAALALRDPPPMSRGLYQAAALTLVAAAAAPLVMTELWVQAQARSDAQRTAQRAARSLLDAAGPGREDDLGRLIAEIPGAAVITASGASYGADLPAGTGPSGQAVPSGPEVFTLHDGGVTAAVAVPRPPPPPLALFGLSAGLCLLAGGAAVMLLVRERERDLRRLRASIAADAGAGPVIAPSTPEWAALARAIDQLVARMHEATIARFVALEKAEETDRLRSQFLANMSHDLRSPLNSILGFSTLLLRGVDGELDLDQREMVETIANAGKDLLHQIDAILDMARIEARRIELQAEPVPLAPLISRAVQKARTRASDQIHYSIETAPGLPTAFVDPRHMVQALENLLLFAGKRLPAGTIAIKLRAGDRDSPLGLQLHITTPVKPSTSQQLDLARRGFHRLPGHRGLGLELPIADALLRIEGCRLDVKEVGGAMLFKVHLPAAESRHKVAVVERARDGISHDSGRTSPAPADP
ncbi:MAG: HAMP domain-containing histidine kinase [Nannocystis sp.]|uniref:sensor histidine kinase n=1 Tax=Nannocystis sp. TaxID=1962667 RepID=UPI0024261D1D|nr:HAMP domain-containing sensor histidine kinase [Nannocystis sp.]MBK9756615.1 HAMP domain-containing histidine kinase [Nannocystis sp.]